MRTSRTEAVLRELSALAYADEAGEELLQATCAALRRAVPFEFACLARTDPASVLITDAYKSDPADSKDAEFARLEYATEDINQFREIAARPDPVGVLEHDTGGHPERSVRYRDFLVPHFSHGHELRAAFRAKHGVWGAIALYRPVGRAGFTDEESAFLARASATVADALSAAAIRSTATTAATSGPAVLVLGRDDQPRATTPGLQDRMAQLGADGATAVPVPLLAIAAAVRARREGLPGPDPRCTIKARSGEWLQLAGAPLATRDPGDADVVITIDQAQPPDIIAVTVAALGLTARERDVVQLVLSGYSTDQIARRLAVSPYTVQDHLKAIFDKAGVRSRRELVASLFAEHHAPRLGQPLNHRGWFAPPPVPPGQPG